MASSAPVFMSLRLLRTVVNKRDSIVFRRNRQHASRETAFAHAIISAGIVHTITKNCSRGELHSCGCDPEKSSNFKFSSLQLMELTESENNTRTHKSDWYWGGCSDKTHYAEKIAKQFMDPLEQGSDAQAHTHLHNNHIGRMVSKILTYCFLYCR